MNLPRPPLALLVLCTLAVTLADGSAQKVLAPQIYALENGGTTLEMTAGGRWLDSMNLYGRMSPFTRVEADQIMGEVSRSLVRQARGQLRVVQGAEYPGSFFRRIEFPEAQLNPGVTGIDAVYLKPRYPFKAGGN